MPKEQIQAPVKVSKKASLTRTAFGVATTIALAACSLGEKIGYVTPTPEGIKNNPSETVPPVGSIKEFAGRLIGEAGIGRVSGLIQNENPDATYMTEISNRALEAFKVEDPSLDQNRIEVHAFEMQGETGNIPFPLVLISNRDNEDIVDSLFVGFGEDENGTLVPPEDGKVDVFLRLITIPRGDGLVVVGVQDQNDPEAMYLPPLFEINQEADEISFNSPYAEPNQEAVRVQVSLKAEFALMPMPEWTRTLSEGLIPVRDESGSWTIGIKKDEANLVLSGVVVDETGMQIEMELGQVLNIPLEEIDTRVRVNEAGGIEVLSEEGKLTGMYENMVWQEVPALPDEFFAQFPNGGFEVRTDGVYAPDAMGKMRLWYEKQPDNTLREIYFRYGEVLTEEKKIELANKLVCEKAVTCISDHSNEYFPASYFEFISTGIVEKRAVIDTQTGDQKGYLWDMLVVSRDANQNPIMAPVLIQVEFLSEPGINQNTPMVPPSYLLKFGLDPETDRKKIFGVEFWIDKYLSEGKVLTLAILDRVIIAPGVTSTDFYRYFENLMGIFGDETHFDKVIKFIDSKGINNDSEFILYYYGSDK